MSAPKDKIKKEIWLKKKHRFAKVNLYCKNKTGIPCSEKTKDKLRKNHKGKHMSINTEFKKGHKLYPGSEKGQFKKGSKPWNYIDGRSKGKCGERYGPEWKNIRKAVFIRDNFTCQFCYKIELLLHCHHKIPFLLTKDNSMKNLITLCSKCHRLEEVRIMRELKKQEVN